MGIVVDVGDASKVDFSDKSYVGALVQYPNTHGRIPEDGAARTLRRARLALPQPAILAASTHSPPQATLAW